MYPWPKSQSRWLAKILLGKPCFAQDYFLMGMTGIRSDIFFQTWNKFFCFKNQITLPYIEKCHTFSSHTVLPWSNIQFSDPRNPNAAKYRMFFYRKHWFPSLNNSSDQSYFKVIVQNSLRRVTDCLSPPYEWKPKPKSRLASKGDQMVIRIWNPK